MASGSSGANALPCVAKDRRIKNRSSAKHSEDGAKRPDEAANGTPPHGGGGTRATPSTEAQAELKQTYKKKGDQRHAQKRRSAAAQTIPKTLFCRAKCPLSFADRQMIQNNVFCILCSTPRPPEIFSFAG